MNETDSSIIVPHANEHIPDDVAVQIKIKKGQAENEEIEYELSDELKREIESKVDLQYKEVYKKMQKHYDDQIYELLCEQERVFGKSEMIKAKIGTLETYLKNFCKINGLDYKELISN